MVDADTYVMLIDLEQRRLESGARTMHIRLRDYSCPERYTEEGIRATAVAADLMANKLLTVELKGKDSFGRTVGWVWAGDFALGPVLQEMGLARAGAFAG